jgi:hypothetical protein
MTLEIGNTKGHFGNTNPLFGNTKRHFLRKNRVKNGLF